MTQAYSWLVLAAVFAGGWLTSEKYRDQARLVSRSLTAIAIMILIALATTGAFHRSAAAAQAHRWIGHGLTIFLWLSIPFAIAVLLPQNLRRRPVATIAQLFALLLVFGVVMLGAFSGYLWQTRQGDVVGAESLNRFLILHLFFFPGVTFALLLEWWWFFGRVSPSFKEENRAS